MIVVAVALFLLTCCGCFTPPDQAAFMSLSSAPEPRERVVQLRCARVPWAPAVHCWLVDFEPSDGRWHRWEVWQDAGSSTTDWGHVRKDLMWPGSGVGDGPSWALAQWRGPEAERLHQVLARPQDYPYCRNYHYWPGPNSNTYIAWILQQATISCQLPGEAIGQDY